MLPTMTFPVTDRFWEEARRFLEQEGKATDPVFAPTGFLDFFPGAYDYYVDLVLPVEHFKFFVFHKGMLGDIRPAFLRRAIEVSHPVFANDVFVIYRQGPGTGPPALGREHMKAFLLQLAGLKESARGPSRTAILVTTYNRSWALERSLAQIAKLGASVLVVDDGSDEPHRRANADVARRHDALLMAHPANRGFACALNTGLAYWLADPSVEWISVFQDDVDVRADALEVLARVQDAHRRPFLTGRYASEHEIVAKERVAGVEVYLQRSTRGTHAHAHRDYWRGVLPAPTWYLGAPKRAGGKPGQGSNADWWITAWSPNSVTKQGLHVVCVPGLVRHFACEADMSTWGGAAERPDPEL
jgi:hypothetical protein